jgi:hypothetical protein
MVRLGEVPQADEEEEAADAGEVFMETAIVRVML